MRRPRCVSVGFHLGCGGEVLMREIHGTRADWARFAEPDEPIYECEECGEWLEPDQVADTYAEALPDEEEEEEG
ncbi:MAG: hypothetical protein CW346_13685 [Bacillaceae bacterium]|nr:hypothetical protein [Bacillaceae bacterium]